MHEQEKIREAEYFYSRMQAEVNNPEFFGYNLSAFLSAARSVLQYTYKEAEEAKARGGLAWYDGRVVHSQVVEFFRNRRNLSVHEKPPSLSQGVTVGLQGALSFSKDLDAVHMDPQGNVIEERHVATEPQQAESAESGVITEYNYSFPEWPDANNVFDLCEMYLVELRAIVQDGVANGFITP